MSGPAIKSVGLAEQLARTTRALEGVRAELVRVTRQRDGLVRDVMGARDKARALSEELARALGRQQAQAAELDANHVSRRQRPVRRLEDHLTGSAVRLRRKTARHLVRLIRLDAHPNAGARQIQGPLPGTMRSLVAKHVGELQLPSARRLRRGRPLASASVG